MRAVVGADQFIIYYRQHAPTLRVAPDIYVLPEVRPDTRVTSWKTWDKGIVPTVALEIVSSDWEKDHVESPETEVVIFDPAPGRHAEGVTWQVYRRVWERPLRRVEVGKGDRIRSKALGCFLRAVGSGDDLRLRLGVGPRADDLFPTAEEAERAAKDAAMVVRDAALRRVLELESKIRRRRSKSRQCRTSKFGHRD